MRLTSTVAGQSKKQLACAANWPIWRHRAESPSFAILLLGSLCVCLFFYGLNQGELYRTESLRAIIAAEFLRSGNWVVPTLYGEPLFTKPPGMYAAIALASLPFGQVTEWSARLPSALAATATVCLFYWFFSRQLGRLGGWLAALVLPASFMWLDKASTAEIDLLQVFWVSAAILFFLRALEIAEARMDAKSADCALRVGRKEWLWWFLSMLCVAGGVLTKWTAPAFFYGTAVPLLWWRGRLRLLFCRQHVVSAACGAALCFAWAGAAISLAGWESFFGTVSREALMRLSPAHHHRPYPWPETLVHPFRILLANLPCSAFALLALRPGFAKLWDGHDRRLLQALHCWIWPNMVFWTVIPDHALRHSFPLFPGLAGLAAFAWLAWIQGKWKKENKKSEDLEVIAWKARPLVPTLRAGIQVPDALHRLPLQETALIVSHDDDAERRGGRSHAERGNEKRNKEKRVAKAFLAMLLLWALVKVVHTEWVVPARNLNREPRAKGEQIACLVPDGQTLYLFRLKDEGIMFYYGREVRRLPGPEQLPSSSEPVYAILDGMEWRAWGSRKNIEKVLQLTDQQGDPIVLVQWLPNETTN